MKQAFYLLLALHLSHIVVVDTRILWAYGLIILIVPTISKTAQKKLLKKSEELKI